jgi:hypothetical protein
MTSESQSSRQPNGTPVRGRFAGTANLDADTELDFQTENGVMEDDGFGNCRWTLNGKLHRLDGAAIERADGARAWYLNGKRHRVGGPAVIGHNGYEMWYQNDIPHRPANEGPALVRADGTREWAENGSYKSPPFGTKLTTAEARLVPVETVVEVTLNTTGERRHYLLALDLPRHGHDKSDLAAPRRFRSFTTMNEAMVGGDSGWSSSDHPVQITSIKVIKSD